MKVDHLTPNQRENLQCLAKSYLQVFSDPHTPESLGAACTLLMDALKDYKVSDGVVDVRQLHKLLTKQEKKDHLKELLTAFLAEASNDPTSPETAQARILLYATAANYNLHLYSWFLDGKEGCCVVDASLLQGLLARNPDPQPEQILPGTPEGTIVVSDKFGFGQLVQNLTAESGTRIIRVQFQSPPRALYMRPEELYYIFPTCQTANRG
jgi:hypothetical protein